MNAYQAGQLVAYIRSFEENPEHITAICDDIEKEFNVTSGPKKYKTRAPMSDEQKAAMKAGRERAAAEKGES